jgi:hypothetical protein
MKQRLKFIKQQYRAKCSHETPARTNVQEEARLSTRLSRQYADKTPDQIN